jgi:hypothetical protein
MAKLADESESFESHTISGLLRGAPDLTSNIDHVESMFQPASEESTSLRYFTLYCFESSQLFQILVNLFLGREKTNASMR